MYLLAEYWSWWVGYFSSIVVPVLAWQSSTARPTGKVAPPLHYPGLGSINPGYVSGLGPGLTLDWDTAHCTTLHYTRYNNIIQQCYYNNHHYYTALHSFASTHILHIGVLILYCRVVVEPTTVDEKMIFFFSVFWGQIWPPTKLAKNVLRFLLKDYWNTIEALFRDERRHPKSIGSYWFLELFACSMSR